MDSHFLSQVQNNLQAGLMWARRVGGGSADEGKAVVPYNDGSDSYVYVAGLYSGTSSIGSYGNVIGPAPSGCGSSGKKAIFVIRLNG